ncbi:glutathione ABC transporter substrate-binding protein [Evansella halocellulosilytica]|uniref:glutathione ABC transporter substrate-binding protein n=1 Tax=Evansella halocellulosilytica TaxID=2011013 RepID=UPI000BB72D35|nr:glutathione ABC transporter substrate-binding protein [Evansella halocellulosilytica]
MKEAKIFHILSLLLLSVLIVACSSEEPSGAEEDEDAADSDVAEEEDGGSDAEASDQENELVIAVNENFITMDPHNTGDRNSNAVQSAMYEGLIAEQDGEIVPMLAEEFEVNDEATEVTFKLREGVTFHDGAAFNAEVVEANFERIRDPDKNLRLYSRGFNEITEIEIVDEYEIKMTLEQPNSNILTKIVPAGMVSPKALEEDADLSQTLVGTGPYQFVEWVQGDHLTIELFEDYWNDGQATVEKITYRPVPENGARVAMLQTGEADFIFPAPTQNLDELEADENIIVETNNSTIANYISLNTMKEPFDDPRVRQALNYAIDKDAFIEVVMAGYASPLDSVLPNTIFNYQEQQSYDYDLEKAKALLAEAGYEDGFSAEIWGNTNSNTVRGMQFIQQQLSQIGVDLEVLSMEEGTLSDRIYGGHTPEEAEVEMWYVSWGGYPSDTDHMIRPILGGDSFPPGGGNSAYFSDEEVDSWLQEANTVTDSDLQYETYGNVQQKIYEEAPWIFLASDENIYALRDHVDGVFVTPNGRINVNHAKIK